ncbi:MAG: hypothetical protein ACK50A_12475 [Sphingobacteriaceae bacterium]|jgi:hypothetical protein
MKKTVLNLETYKVESKSLNKVYGGTLNGGNTPDTTSDKDGKKNVADDCEETQDTIKVIIKPVIPV